MRENKAYRLKLVNAIDNIISRGFSTLVLALLVVTLIVVAIAGAIYVAFRPTDDMSVIEALWTAFGYISSPQLPPFSDTADVVIYAVVTFFIVVIGLLVTSSLIGIINNALSDYYENLQRGFSPVLEEDHFVIIGFNDTVNILLDELTKAFDEKEKWSLVFIDGKLDRKSMEQHLENYLGLSLKRFTKQQNCKILCRCGDPHNTEDLRRYAVDRAKAVIINEYEDPIILKDLLAVSSLIRMSDCANDPEKQPAIVCAFNDEQYASAARCIGNQNLRVLSLSSTLADMVAKTCYQPGVSYIISDLYDFDGSELYMKSFPSLTGKHFDELTMLFGASIPIGICRPDARADYGVDIIVNRPGLGNPIFVQDSYEALMTLQEDDRLIFLATGKNELVLKSDSCELGPTEDYVCGKHVSSRETNRILVLGYDETFDSTVANLASHYWENSSSPEDTNCYIKLIYRNKREARAMIARQRFLDGKISRDLACEEIEQAHGVNSSMQKIKDIRFGTTQISFHCARQNHFDLPLLESILFSGEDFKHIVVLSDLSTAKEEADTETLLTLLYLRAISENAKHGVYGEQRLVSFHITSEIQNMENINLAYNEYVSDYIISWKFIASLQVQIAVDKNLYAILRDLLKSGRADIRLEPLSHFVRAGFFEDAAGAGAGAGAGGAGAGGAPVDLDQIAQLMRDIEDVAEKRLLLGYKRSDGSFVLNPERDSEGRRIAYLDRDDLLVIMANT